MTEVSGLIPSWKCEAGCPWMMLGGILASRINFNANLIWSKISCFPLPCSLRLLSWLLPVLGTSEVPSSLRAVAPANSLCLPVFIQLYPCIGLSINGASSEFSLKSSLYGSSLLFSIFPHSFPHGFAVICVMFLAYLVIVFLHRTKLNEGENCIYHVFLSA